MNSTSEHDLISLTHVNRFKGVSRIRSAEVVRVGFPLCFHFWDVEGQRPSLLPPTWSTEIQARDVLGHLRPRPSYTGVAGSGRSAKDMPTNFPHSLFCKLRCPVL